MSNENKQNDERAECAHDYVRSDRLCTECGERVTVAETKPVAWKTTHKNVCLPITEDKGIAEYWRACGWPVTDLFAAVPQAMPLTDEQREAIKYARSVMGSVSWETPDSIRAKAALDALIAQGAAQ